MVILFCVFLIVFCGLYVLFLIVFRVDPQDWASSSSDSNWNSKDLSTRPNSKKDSWFVDVINVSPGKDNFDAGHDARFWY